MTRQAIEASFPSLRSSRYQITSPSTPEYNCIAWAAGEDDVWWWPDINYQYFWPAGIPREETLAAFIAAFNSLGYSTCSHGELEDRYSKVAIYVDQNGKPTHAARQLPDGKWTSKLGSIEDISHEIHCLTGSIYGNVAVFMRKPV